MNLQKSKYVIVMVFVIIIITFVVCFVIWRNNGTKEQLLQTNRNQTIIKELLKTTRFETILNNNNNNNMHDCKQFIDEIVYINLDQSIDRRQLIEQEINTMFPNCPKVRLSAIQKNPGELGCLLSHLAALSRCVSENKNILIMEDDFVFIDSKEILLDKLNNVNKVFGDKWDVITLGQYCHGWSHIIDSKGTRNNILMRLTHSTTASAYIVHKNYAKIYYEAVFKHAQTRLFKTSFQKNDHIDQFHISLQKQHIWIGFTSSVGKQRPSISTIGNVQCDNEWKTTPDLKYWINSRGVETLINIEPDFQVFKIAICCVATGKYIKFVNDIITDLNKHFCRGHKVEVLLFTDDKTYKHNDMKTTIYPTKQKGFPGDTLYRYHYIHTAKQQLINTDYIFYIDVDYKIITDVRLHDIFPIGEKGIVATNHLFNITPKIRKTNIIGTPETNNMSTAYISPDEFMLSYFAGGFQGGSSHEFLNMCKQIMINIDIDDSNQVMAIWHDESHFNRYMLNNPPVKTLSQSYIYPEFCLNNPTSELTICQELQTNDIIPKMIPLDKDHKAIRS
jgi:histo-blood group ABO system transferase